MTGSRGALTKIDLPLRRLASGKVRELYRLDGSLLFVASDRISAFDVVMPQGIPDKGRLLTGLSLFWFDLVSDMCPNHLVSASYGKLPVELLSHLDNLRGRFMIVRRLEMLPVEFVVRGYLAGSGWRDYVASGTVSGVRLPPGLRQAERLPEPIFTPATKSKSGHDENITEAAAAYLCGLDVLKRAKECALAVYDRASGLAAECGLILADTKFEFGLEKGEVVLADEILTPDSSRFWPAEAYRPATSPPSFDKQYLRDWLDRQGWDRQPPAPDLPDEVIEKTRANYVQAFELLVGRSLDSYLDGA